MDIDALEPFPDDDRTWWIRWVDRYSLPGGATSTRHATVLLSRFPNRLEGHDLRTIDVAELIAEDTPTVRAIVPAGAIPRLVIGAVFRRRSPAGSLPTTTATFDFDRRICEARVVQAFEKVPTRKGGSAYPAIPRNFYPLEEFRTSCCLLIQQGDVRLAIPCHEILRCLYAPIQPIALALMNGPWERDWPRVANPEKTGCLAEGNWRIWLRKEIPDEVGPLLANLILNPNGWVAANRVYTDLARDAKASVIGADIPFEWTNLRITVKSVENPRWRGQRLAFEIVAVSWPHAFRFVEVGRDNPRGQPPATHDEAHPTRAITRRTETAEGDDPFPVVGDVDAASRTTAWPHDVAGMVWTDGPEIRRIDGLRDNFRSAAHPPTTRDPPSSGSPAARTGPDGQPRPTRYASRPGAGECIDFERVARMLDRLRDASRIRDWSPLEPHGDARYRGSLSVWLLPTPPDIARVGEALPAWMFADPERRMRRTALVCRIVVRATEVLRIDLEPRWGGEHAKPRGTRYIYVAPGPIPLEATVRTLLLEVVRNGGTWPKVEVLLRASRAVAIRVRNHRYAGRNHSVHNNETMDRELDHTSALTCMRELLGRHP